MEDFDSCSGSWRQRNRDGDVLIKVLISKANKGCSKREERAGGPTHNDYKYNIRVTLVLASV